MDELFAPLAPRSYQKDAVALAVDAFEHHEHSCLTLPTGAGKTVVLTALIKWFRKNMKSVLLLSNRILLLEQTSRVLDHHGISYGVIAATMPNRKATLRDIQLGSLQTLTRRIITDKREEAYPFDVILVDEVHQCSSGTSLALIQKYQALGAVTLGVTATPMGVSHLYPRLIIAGTTSQCRRAGALVPAVYKAPCEMDFSKLEVQDSGEFNYKEVKKQYKPYVVGHVFDNWRKYNPDMRPTLGFAPGVPESKWFTDQFEARGVRAAHIDGEDVYVDHCNYKSSQEVRDQVIADWRAGHIKVLWNRFVMREGIDFPWMYCLLLACPIGSLHSYIQACGRVLRHSPETPDFVQILDFCGNYYRHGYSPNDDIDWEQYYFEAISVPTRHQKLKLAQDSEREPLRCPNCGNVIRRGSECPPPPLGCGYRITRRSRSVIQKDGTLRDVHHPAVPKMRIRMAPNTLKIWERCYHRCKKAGMHLSQARGLFVYENFYWPPPNLPLMPKKELHWFRKIEEVDRKDLYSHEEYERSK